MVGNRSCPFSPCRSINFFPRNLISRGGCRSDEGTVEASLGTNGGQKDARLLKVAEMKVYRSVPSVGLFLNKFARIVSPLFPLPSFFFFRPS